MGKVNQETVSKALADAVQRLLAQNQAAVVPGLGTVSVQHEPSHVDRKENGGFTITPCRRTLMFTAEHEDD